MKTIQHEARGFVSRIVAEETFDGLVVADVHIVIERRDTQMMIVWDVPLPAFDGEGNAFMPIGGNGQILVTGRLDDVIGPVSEFLESIERKFDIRGFRGIRNVLRTTKTAPPAYDDGVVRTWLFGLEVK